MRDRRLIDYILGEVDRGVPESAIRQSLMNAGWSAERLDQAWREAGREVDKAFLARLRSNIRLYLRMDLYFYIACLLFLFAILLTDLAHYLIAR